MNGTDSKHTPQGEALTALMLEIFRVNGQLLASGDTLVQDIGLTSARWQVLGALALAEQPLPVAGIARNMGLTRQSVQRVVNDLQREGLLVLEPNPHHKRAKLVLLTPAGRTVYAKAHARQVLWANTLAGGMDTEAITDALALLRRVSARCQEWDAAAAKAS